MSGKGMRSAITHENPVPYGVLPFEPNSGLETVRPGRDFRQGCVSSSAFRQVSASQRAPASPRQEAEAGYGRPLGLAPDGEPAASDVSHPSPRLCRFPLLR